VTTPTLTDQVCACGCGNILLSTIAERGWRYIRGHKPRGAAKPKALPAAFKAIGPDQIKSYFDAQIADFRASLAQLRLQHSELLERIEANKAAQAQLDKSVASANDARRAAEAHFTGLFKERKS
jgi:hypothetical protein